MFIFFLFLRDPQLGRGEREGDAKSEAGSGLSGRA